MEDSFNILKQLPFFKEISETLLNNVLKSKGCGVQKYGKSAIIHLQNEQCIAVEVILSGSVTVQRLDALGNVLTIADFYAGDLLGSNLLFSTTPCYPMTVVAKSDCKIMSLTTDLILKLCKESTSFLNAFLREISNKTLVLTGKISNIAMKNIRQCIVDFLLIESKIQNSNTILLPFSKKEWAERLGIQRPSLSRLLHQMEQEGLIRFENRKIELLSLEK